MSDLLSVGLSGVRSSQTGLTVAGNNISNVDTAGYSQQSTVQVSKSEKSYGAYYVGTGSTVTDVRRSYSSYLATQVSTSTASNSSAQAYYTQIQQTDALLADSTTGLSSTMQSFFDSISTASASPTDTSSRQLVLSEANGLAERFNSIYNQLDDQNGYINQQLSSITDQVNSLASSVADYNQAITEASASGETPNALLDARDEAVRELNELVGVTVVEQDGNYNLYVGSGQPLVTGSNYNTVSASASESDPTRYAVYLEQGSVTQDITSVVSGGSMGGLLDYREEVLEPTFNEVGQIALVLTDQINSQLGQGLDLNGDFGASLFTSVNSESAMSERSLANSNNASGSANLTVMIEDSSQITTSNYEVTIEADNAYTVTRLSDGEVAGTGDLDDTSAVVIDGFSISLSSGTVAEGDSFTIIPTRTAASNVEVSMTDSSQLAFAAPLSAELTTGNLGSLSITQPTLDTELNIYDDTENSETQEAIEEGTPLKIVFSAVDSGSQGYSVYDSSGAEIDTGTIVPGNSNEITVSVPDSSGTEVFSFSMTVSGTPAEGDSLTVSFNEDGVSDNRNAEALVALQTEDTVETQSGGGNSITGAYSALIEQVGARTNQAETNASSTASILDSAVANQASVSGVNLDDEAVRLVEYQQYYTASSKVISVASEIFNTLINAV